MSPDQFRVDGPPPLGSAQWAEDFNEVRNFGAASDLPNFRSAEQEDIGLFYGAINAQLQIGRNLRRLAQDQHLTDDIDETAHQIPATEDGPVRLAERRDDRRMWARLLADLPPKYRLAVALRHVEGLSYEELSETLDRPVGSVKSDVHRGIALLRAAYDAEQREIAQKEAV